MDKESQSESLEESIFKTLNHQKRRDILRVIGEKKQVTFTEVKNAVVVEDSSSLSYHLNALNGLIIQHEGKYQLSELGQNAYSLICKTASSTESSSMLSFLRREIPAVIVINAVLWAAALILTGQFEGKLSHNTVFSFAALWLISNGILYSILTKIRKNERSCSIRTK